MTLPFLRPTWGLGNLKSGQLTRSLTTASAIRRGIGKSQKDTARQRLEDGVVRSRKPGGRSDSIAERRTKDRSARSFTSPNEPLEIPGYHSERVKSSRSFPKKNPGHQQDHQDWKTLNQSPSTTQRIGNSSRESSDRRTRVSRPRDRMPIAIPHTTAASEFLYGRSAVEAALRARRRKLYKLYIHNPKDITLSQLHSNPIVKLADTAGVKVESLLSDQLLQKISAGRPTNGYVLEASPLPLPRCSSLEKVDRASNAFRVVRSVQSQEEREISGTQSMVQYESGRQRFPLVILLDGILDPMNLGGILRSAFFLGADAVVLSSHGSPLTVAALKAASGAAETLPILLTHATGPFIRSSQSHGWKFYAASPSPERNESLRKPAYSLENLNSPLTKHPSVVILGNEGLGLWQDVESKCDYFVSIKGLRGAQGGVDSLNVSVSAALLIQAFTRPSPYSNPRNRLWDGAY